MNKNHFYLTSLSGLYNCNYLDFTTYEHNNLHQKDYMMSPGATVFYLQQTQQFRLLFISISGTGIILAMFALWYLSLAVDEIR